MKEAIKNIWRQAKTPILSSICALGTVVAFFAVASALNENTDLAMARIEGNREQKTAIVKTLPPEMQELINTMDNTDVPDNTWDKLMQINRLNRDINSDKKIVEKNVEQGSKIL